MSYDYTPFPYRKQKSEIEHCTLYAQCSISDNPGERNYVRIRKVRFICMDCGATYTNALKGIIENTNLTERTLQLIKVSFTEMLTFEQIGRTYGLSDARIIQLFDELVPFVPRRLFPKYLCIDEVKMDGN